MSYFIFGILIFSPINIFTASAWIFTPELLDRDMIPAILGFISVSFGTPSLSSIVWKKKGPENFIVSEIFSAISLSFSFFTIYPFVATPDLESIRSCGTHAKSFPSFEQRQSTEYSFPPRNSWIIGLGTLSYNASNSSLELIL